MSGFDGWNREHELSAPFRRRFTAKLTFMSLCDRSPEGKAQPHARAAARQLVAPAPEGLEDLLALRFWDPGPSVTDDETDLPLAAEGREGQWPGSILARVVEQVNQGPDQRFAISADRRSVTLQLENELDTLFVAEEAGRLGG